MHQVLVYIHMEILRWVPVIVYTCIAFLLHVAIKQIIIMIGQSVTLA